LIPRKEIALSFYKFDKKSSLLNYLNAFPEYSLFIYDGKKYLNNFDSVSGAYSDSITGTPSGFVNLYELNINRPASNGIAGTGSNVIYPFIRQSEKDYLTLSSLTSGSQKKDSFRTDITGSYPLSSSVMNYYFTAGGSLSPKNKLSALKNTINYYSFDSNHFQFSSSVHARDLSLSDLSLITIPSIITGGGLKRGSVSLKYYVSGALQAELTDSSRRGELVQVSGTIAANDGRVAGIVLYNEGAIILTGAWDLNDTHTENYVSFSSETPKWIYFGSSTADNLSSISTPSSSYELTFKAKEEIPNLTLHAVAPRGELNYSNNPTFLSASSLNAITGSRGYFEDAGRTIKNIVSSSFTQTTGSFEKITYITKIGIYDEYKNLIAVANLANPVRKREKDSFTFKLKMDL